jgi:hypothetical protein
LTICAIHVIGHADARIGSRTVKLACTGGVLR